MNVLPPRLDDVKPFRAPDQRASIFNKALKQTASLRPDFRAADLTGPKLYSSVN
jgi:hypothetical protein